MRSSSEVGNDVHDGIARFALDSGVAVSEGEALLAAWGEFLDRYDWSMFATLTFSSPATEERARDALRKWLRRVEQRVGCGVAAYYVAERSRAGLLHFHALCYSARGHADDYRSAWTFGRAEVEPHRRLLGGRYYVVKEMLTPWLEFYDFTSRVPPLRSHEDEPPY
jgi:hypothetical protein